MSFFRSLWDSFFYLPPFEDPDRERVARAILRIFAGSFALALITIAYYLINGIWLHGILLTGVILTGMYSLRYIRKDQFEHAFILFFSVGIAGLIIVISFASGLYALEILAIFPTLVVLSYFASSRVMYVWLIILVVWIWTLYLVQMLGIYEPNPSQVGPFGQALFLSLIIIFSVMMLQFTTQRMKSVNETLSQAKQAAEDASQSKSNFLATMSHELRTPLNAIIGYSEVLMEDIQTIGELSADAEIDLERIHKSGKNLLMIINDILDISKVDAEKLELNISTFSLDELIQDLVGTIGPQMAQNRNQLSVCFEDTDQPIYIYSDRERMGQVLLNLLSNAAKFTYDGSVELRVTLSKEDLHIEVADTGVGIGQEDIDRIFEAFQQVDSSMARKAYGTGLGLAISKRLSILLGGELTVESELGVGTLFTLIIPEDSLVPAVVSQV
ncbi:MAG: ATP-binding protein [Chloroflexota bacterium]